MESTTAQQQHASTGFATTGKPVVGSRGSELDTNLPHAHAHPHRPAGNDSPVTMSPASITSPPYWVQSHQRSLSSVSLESSHGGITLQDNTDDSGHGEDAKNKACWAKSVVIEDHVVVKGNHAGVGAFVVWNCTVETLRGGSFHIRKRYSEFDDLRDKLLQTFPLSTAAMPPLPPKGLISKYRPKFLENRRAGLQYFLNCILLNPEFSGSPVLKEFLFEK